MKKTKTNDASITRCTWCGSDPLYVKYHDEEWGVPVYDDNKLFEFIVLEGAQAGLSWITVLRRREGYRKAFANFDPKKVAKFSEKDFERLMNDVGIIRNKAKIQAAITNAHRFLEVQKEFGSFAKYIWGFLPDGKPIVNNWKKDGELVARTELSDLISKDMKRRGFKFFGTTICYAHMQATGMINDHTVSCFRYKEI